MCIVLNAKDVCVTGRKLTDKFYRWHTGYVGHLKERSLKDQLAKDPTEVIRKAVLRMLPNNKLRDDRDRKLRIFAESYHPFTDRPLEPYVTPPRTVREMRPRARCALIRAQKKEEQKATPPDNPFQFCIEVWFFRSFFLQIGACNLFIMDVDLRADFVSPRDSLMFLAFFELYTCFHNCVMATRRTNQSNVFKTQHLCFFWW
ncbi:Ribosomal protein L13 protein [Dioscorea alata]|uniref:Ribosomal protein L13 protein n=1 Tax=Dioscorea alata TaxID=55571 RepID=A0ACB7VR84_DIOAL|nr:Ribosomal protein L13 protein [Dioscorea alata]